MQVNGRRNIDELLARMEAVRGRLDHDARAAKQSVQEMTDWRTVVRRNPLASIAVAAVAGFLLVPKKKTQPSFSSEDLKRLSKDHTVIVTKEPTASPGLIGTVTAIAGAALARAATNFIAAKVSKFSVPREREAT
jgi:hypothetical protein